MKWLEKIKSLGTRNLLGKYRRPCSERLSDSRMDKRNSQKSVDNNKSFAYNPTKGLLETREFLVKKEIPKTEPRLPPKIFAFSTDWATPSPKCTHILKKKLASSVLRPLIPLTRPPKARTPAIPISLTIFLPEKIGSLTYKTCVIK